MSLAAPPDRAPDLIDPVVGFRYWCLRDGWLCSPWAEHRWTRGVNTARCTLGTDHAEPAPGHRCACGLHAWYRPCPRLGYASPDFVSGAVALWGEVELHEAGLRAEHAAIVALVLPLARTRKRRRLLEIADALEVETVPAPQLEAVAGRSGLLTPGSGWLAGAAVG